MPSVHRTIVIASTVAVFGGAPAVVRAQAGAYMRGVELEEAGRFGEAAAAYREVLRASPASVPAVLGLERVYALLGRTDSLLPLLDQAIAVQPAQAAFRVAQLRSYRSLGRSEELRAAFERWRQDWPSDPMPYREYAKLLIQDGETNAADSVLRNAQIQLRGSRGLELELAQLRAAMGLWEESALAWRSALIGAPYLEQAAIFSLTPAATASRESVRRVLLAGPVAVSPRRVAAALELNWGAARDGWNVLRELPPDSLTLAAWLDFARRAEEAGEWLAARDALVAVLRHRPETALAVRAAGNALNGGDARSALALATAAGDGEESAEAAASLLMVRVRALASLGRADEAERVAAARSGVLPPELRARLDEVVVWAWVRAGNTARAREMLARSGGTARGEAMGWLALYDGDLRVARRLLQRPEEPTPELVTARALLSRTGADTARHAGRGFLALAQGDTLGAIAALSEAARELPDAASLLLATAARLHAARRDDERAMTLWKTIALSHADTPEAPEAELEWARALRRAGEQAAAVERLEHLILTYPQSALVPQARRELELARALVPPTS